MTYGNAEGRQRTAKSQKSRQHDDETFVAQVADAALGAIRLPSDRADRAQRTSWAFEIPVTDTFVRTTATRPRQSDIGMATKARMASYSPT